MDSKRNFLVQKIPHGKLLLRHDLLRSLKDWPGEQLHEPLNLFAEQFEV